MPEYDCIVHTNRRFLDYTLYRVQFCIVYFIQLQPRVDNGSDTTSRQATVHQILASYGVRVSNQLSTSPQPSQPFDLFRPRCTTVTLPQVPTALARVTDRDAHKRSHRISSADKIHHSQCSAPDPFTPQSSKIPTCSIQREVALSGNMHTLHLSQFLYLQPDLR